MTSAALVQTSEAPRTRLSVPRRGHVLSTISENYGGPVRTAVDIIASALHGIAPNLAQTYSPRQTVGAEALVHHSIAEMEAWHLCTKWIIGVALGALHATDTLEDAAEWFGPVGAQTSVSSPPALSAQSQKEALEQLRSIADPYALADLLPYILDPHGPGSRLSVMRNPSTRVTRDRKRTDGVFYTPADVAEHMAALALANECSVRHPTRVFDPACGTGVFLRAALSILQEKNPDIDRATLATQSLYGVDIDPWAVDASAYVLTYDVLAACPSKSSPPSSVWQPLRRNLFVIDALSLDPASPLESTGMKQPGSRGVPITEVFPAMGDGPHVILGNPPYASLTGRTDLAGLHTRFKTLPTLSPTSDIHPLFVEQMMRLAAPAAAGALVLPLSIAFSSGKQYVAARRLIQQTAGTWRFSFFDREPHALFGEDVKTRNAIVLWSRTPADTRSVFGTGPLRKWRGDSRSAMFRSLGFTVVDADIRAGIPKIDGSRQAAAFKALSLRWGRLEQFARSIERVDLADVPDADDRTVFVGATAYNFVNVFLRPPQGVLAKRSVLSEHPLHALKCVSRTDALAVFAVLSSHLAYWWWHTHGDGFHVSRRFIAELPFGIEDLTEKVTCTLAESGEELWAVIKSRPIISVNRGSTSLAFTPNGHDDVRRKIDETLAALAGLERAFVNELQQFTAHTVAATLRVPELIATEE